MKAELSKYISDLLFDHDCVIVPSLGGFLASNQSSRILMPNQVIYPPYRKIAFNVYIKQNDGLLANHLVESENISYAEALAMIELFVANCFDTLGKGMKVTITEVGTLFYDREKNIQFDAFRNFNHLKDSFGMEAIHLAPIVRDVKTVTGKIVTSPVRKSVPIEKKGKSTFVFTRKRKIIGGVAIGVALVLFSINLYFVAPKKYEATSLYPFDPGEIVITKTDSIRNIPATAPSADSQDVPVETQTESPVANEHLASQDSEVVPFRDAEASQPIAENTRPVISSESMPKTITNPVPVQPNRQFVVAGVFKIEENAKNLLLKLQHSGFANAVIIEANGFSYVAYDNFSNYNQALALTDSLKDQSLEGWIWKH